MNMVAFIHGFLGTPADWDPIRARLDMSSVALAVPVANHWQQGVDRVGSQIPRDSVLVGYSLGGRVALGCALANPTQIRGLVVVSANPGIDDAERERRWQWDQDVCRRLRSEPPEVFLRRWYGQDVFQSLSEREVQELMIEKRDLDPQHFAGLLECYSIARQPNFWPRLMELTLPVVVIVGQRDDKYLRIGQKMAQAIPNSRLETVPAAGHIVPREQPGRFCEILTHFISCLPEEECSDA